MKYLTSSDCACPTTEKLRSVQAKLLASELPFILVTAINQELLGFFSLADIERQIFAYGFDGDIDTKLLRPCRFVKIEGVSLEEDRRAKAYGFLPVVSVSGALVGCEYYERDQLHRIGESYIGDGMPPFLVGEVGINHQGSMRLAQTYIDGLKDAGFDAIKFQMRDLDSIYRQGYLENESRAVEDEYSSNIIRKFSLTNDQILQLIQTNNDLNVFATPFDLKSARQLLDIGPACIKTASADLSFLALHELLASSGVPTIVSTGAARLDDIDIVVDIYRRHNQTPILLHCVANYPPNAEQLNLLNITTLRERYGCPVGYSSHDIGQDASLQAVGLGACLIEKHVTFDSSLEGNDHKVSLPVDEWDSFAAGLRTAFSRLGSPYREVNQGEKLIRVSLGKSLYARVDIIKDTPLAPHLFESRSPFKGFTELDLYKNGGGFALKNIAAGEPLEQSNVGFLHSSSGTEAVPYEALEIPENIGVPVRFNDYSNAISETRSAGVEFHLSEGDLARSVNDPSLLESVKDGLKGRVSWVAVHAPDQFSGDFVVDLSAEDPQALDKSYEILLDTMRFADRIARATDLGRIVPVVANLGSVSYERLEADEARKKQERITQNMQRFLELPELKAINQSVVKLMPQTMPPYPWIFGGSRFLNALIESDDILRFCASTGLSVTLDVAHSLMHCIDRDIPFEDFLGEIESTVGYVHLGDAVNATSEGLALGTGTLDLSSFLQWMSGRGLTGVTEIWSGHLDNFAGFKTALRTVSDTSSELEINWRRSRLCR
jgi:sialic acid synthase SpsE/sugar phosphate isomerase/epimerase